MSNHKKSLFRKVMNDVFTSENGEDIDPARLFGYGFVILGSIEFLLATLYILIKHGTFDAMNFSTGLVGISGALMAAAAGVRIKKDTESPPNPIQASILPTPAPQPLPPLQTPMPADAPAPKSSTPSKFIGQNQLAVPIAETTILEEPKVKNIRISNKKESS